MKINRSVIQGIFMYCTTLVISFPAMSGQVRHGELNVLEESSGRPDSDDMMRSYLREMSYQAFDRRLAHFETLDSVEKIEAHQKDLKAFLLEKLNLPKEKTPLNPRIVDRFNYENFSVEKIIFESQPRFYVTALLYLPLSVEPCPAVLVLCGHNELGKAYDQEICMGLVRNGIAALCIDPIGQGERKQVLDKNGKGAYRATTEHMIAGVAPILLGKTIGTYMVWDAIRSLDYLESRPEIDASRMGVTGYSGGGNRGSYLMAFDDRIKAAAPGCYITTSRRKNDAKGPGDAEQNFHGQFSKGLDLPDYLIMAAPKPVLILSATQDFVPIEGTWEAFRQAKRIYTRLGVSDRVGILETDNTHGYWPEMRVGAINWMRRWLMDKHDQVAEESYVRIDAEKLLCTPKGQVLLIPGAKSVFDLNRESAQKLVSKRNEFLFNSSPAVIREQIRKLTGIRSVGTLPRAEVIDRGEIQRDGYRIQKLVLEWESGIQLPSLLFHPEKAVGGFYVYVNDVGKNAVSGTGGEVEALAQLGNTVLAMDVRGIGETATVPWRYEYAYPFTSNDLPDFFIAYMLDKTFVGMRAEDILVGARFLKSQAPGGHNREIKIISHGETGAGALHAAALEPDLIGQVSLKHSLVSWNSVIENDLTKNALNTVVHDGLGYYDLPDLDSLVKANNIIVIGPVDAAGVMINK